MWFLSGKDERPHRRAAKVDPFVEEGQPVCGVNQPKAVKRGHQVVGRGMGQTEQRTVTVNLGKASEVARIKRIGDQGIELLSPIIQRWLRKFEQLG